MVLCVSYIHIPGEKCVANTRTEIPTLLISSVHTFYSLYIYFVLIKHCARGSVSNSNFCHAHTLLTNIWFSYLLSCFIYSHSISPSPAPALFSSTHNFFFSPFSLCLFLKLFMHSIILLRPVNDSLLFVWFLFYFISFHFIFVIAKYSMRLHEKPRNLDRLKWIYETFVKRFFITFIQTYK